MLRISICEMNKVIQERVQIKEMPVGLQGDEYNTLVVLDGQRMMVMTAVDLVL